MIFYFVFFFNDTATTEIYTLSLHDALPISGLIVGPGDPTDRYTYWPVRIDRGGEALAPGSPEDPVQYVDARDLAAWIVGDVERGTVGVFNATGPERTLGIGAMLASCRKAA